MRTYEETIGARLKAQRTQMGLSQEELAKRADNMPLDSYKKYEGDSRIPGGEALAALGKAGVNLAQLLMGGDSPGPRAEQPRADYVYIPLYDVRASAGGGAIAPTQERVVHELAFKADWIRSSLGVAPDDLLLVYVEGDSQEPDLRAGDIILVNKRDTTATREGFYVMRMDDALLVKQVQRLPGGILKLMSRNPAYEPIMLPMPIIDQKDKFQIIGRVVWACRRL